MKDIIDYSQYIRLAAQEYHDSGQHNRGDILNDAANACAEMYLQLTHYEIGAEMNIEEEKKEAAELAALQASNAQKSLTIDALVTECDRMKQERDALREIAQKIVTLWKDSESGDINIGFDWAFEELAAALKESK